MINHWNGGFQGEACFDITQELHGWRAHLKFDQPVNSLEIWIADLAETLTSGTGTEFVVTNKDYNMDEHVGDRLCLGFLGHGNGDINPTATAYIEGMTAGPTAAPGQTLPSLAPGETRPPPPTTTLRPLPPLTGEEVTSKLTINGNINQGQYEGIFDFKIKEYELGWVANFTFNVPMKNLQLWDADVLTHSPDGYTWTIVNKGDRDGPAPGDTLRLKFRATIDGPTGTTPEGQAILYNMGIDPFNVTEAPNADKSKYNYNDVLFKSLMFYEAQRSGKLPADNRIPWRGDSALGDKGNGGEDLTGGWYDAGDHIKFNFPMASATTVLTWGYLQFKDAYVASGQADQLLNQVKWTLDYLLKCHTKPEELYVQVGNAGADHGYWGAPETMTMARPAYKIDASKPGSDVAMETAAAMAAGYLAFKDINATYANTLLEHAKQLWEFGMKYKGKYSNSVSAAAGFYTSNNYTDELCWGSLWMYQATNDSKYLAEAEKLFDPEPAWGFSWDEKTIGNQVLLYKLTGKDVYKQAVEGTYTSWFPGGDLQYTPKGLAYRLQWGSLRYSSNMAMGALMAAEEGIHPKEYRHWAMCQLHYALGDTGRSYVVGFGTNPPKSPHHRSSSCPLLPAKCGSYVMRSPAPNPHTLYGALVGGPGNSDDYKDDRSNYVNNEVATDYNSGFTTAIAGLKSLWVNNEHPEQLGDSTCPYTQSGSSIVGRRRRRFA